MRRKIRGQPLASKCGLLRVLTRTLFDGRLKLRDLRRILGSDLATERRFAVLGFEPRTEFRTRVHPAIETIA
ncbi:MAG: hypothetical protein DMF63_02375 [Acidobacteria bacterium]|nr:MAG: hypothetical protein DMF63_02375 [Acidobacteriota bacterium]